MELTLITPELHEQLNQFVAATVADGWDIEPMYKNHRTEGVARAALLEKDGFKINVVNRLGENVYQGPIHGWGPDKLAIDINIPYDWEKIKDSVNICGICDQKKPKLQRVGYANRVCTDCLPEAKAEIEKPGWTK